MYQEIFDMETETEARSKKRKSEREIVRKIEKTFEKTAGSSLMGHMETTLPICRQKLKWI